MTFLNPETQCRVLAFDPHNPDHTQSFVRLNTQWIEHYFALEKNDHVIFADPQKTIIDKGGMIAMARWEHRIVGTGALMRRADDIYELARFAVHPEAQNQGIGRAIADYLLNEARQREISRVFLVTNTKLKAAAALYARLGFVTSRVDLHQHYSRANITMEKVL